MTFEPQEDHYIGTNGVAHVYFTQTVNGTKIVNFDVNVNIDSNGNVFSHGFHVFNDVYAPAQAGLLDPLGALQGAVRELGLPVYLKRAKIHAQRLIKHAEFVELPLEYVVTRTKGAAFDPTIKFAYWGMHDGTVVPTWQINIESAAGAYLVFVEMKKNTVLKVIDRGSHFSSFKSFVNTNPSQGPRTVLEDSWDIEASKLGWLSDGTREYEGTQGNNAIVMDDFTGWTTLNETRQFEPDYNADKTLGENIDAAVTQAFFTVNKAHDIFYKLGFTESAGNFQKNNFGKGGQDNDRLAVRIQVQMDHQWKPFRNNAYYLHDVDGKEATIRLGIFYYTDPPKDSAFDSQIIVHEVTHGLSYRLTGGSLSENCLSTWESRGLSEGWSDFMALAMSLNSTSRRAQKKTIGAWLTGNDEIGIRTYAYSTNCRINPVVYEELNDLELSDRPSIYDTGTFFANVLFEMMWNLIEKHGIDDDDPPKFLPKTIIPTDGRYLSMRLVMDAMAL